VIWGSNPGRGKRLSLLQNCPEWLSSPSSPLICGYWGCFPTDKTSRE